MIKNRLNSVLLSILLLVSGHISCSEQPVSQVPQGILSKLYLSMPSAPTWMTNLTTNMTSSFSSLSDKTKYLIYGAIAALFGVSYLGYRGLSSTSLSSPSTPVPTSMGNKYFWPSDRATLNSTANCSNIAYITRDYVTLRGDAKRELAFNHYVCPVLTAHEDSLDTSDKWKAFLQDIHRNARGITMSGRGLNQTGLNMFVLINKTCPNEKIIAPLKEYLLPFVKTDKEALKILNQ